MQCIIAVGAALASGIFAIAWAANDDLARDSKYRPYFMRLVKIFAVAGIVACVPSVDQIWKIRIGLIKLQLASPENLQKGTDEIQRIAKKLECKYVGCDDKEKAK